MEWLCCLQCRVRPQESHKSSFYVSDCGHITCRSCRERVETQKCAECQKPQPQYKQLTHGISDDPAVGLYFGDLLHWSKRAAKFYEFQAYHMKRSLCNVKNQDLDLPNNSPELKCLSGMSVGSLQGLWIQELNHFSGMKFQYQQIMNVIQQIRTHQAIQCADILSFSVGCSDVIHILIATAPISSLNRTDVLNGSNTQSSSRSPNSKISGKRLSIIPPPSGGRIGTADFQQSLKPNSTIYKFLQKHTPHSSPIQ